VLLTIVDNKRLCIRNRIVRCANAKEIVFATEMNKKLLCVMSWTVFFCLIVDLLVLLAWIIIVTALIRRSLQG